MARNAQPRSRQRGRELFTVLLAFGAAALVGRGLVQDMGSPPLIVSMIVFLVLYVLAYFAIWRLSAYLFGGP